MGASRDYDALADALDRETAAAELPPLGVYEEDIAPRRANGKAPHAPAEEQIMPSPGAVLEWDTLVGNEPPERQWIVPHWIPAGHVTLLSGRGGVGKSLLAQHLGTAIAAGASYLETLAPKTVLMWAAEDDYDELWRRQINISSQLEVPLEKLGNFRLRSCVGCDVTLASPVFNALSPTPLLQTLAEERKEHGADLVIIDNIARVFGGNENDRHQVTTFIAWLQAACAPAAVLLLGHPAKAVGSEFSGSTAWEGAVRARLYFSDRPPDEKAAEDEFSADESVRYLSRRKANYSELDMRKFELRDGALIPEPIQRHVSSRVSGQFVRDIVARAVRKLGARDLYGTSATGSPNYLPRLAQQYQLLENATPSSFAVTMRQMIMDGGLVAIQVGQYPNRTPKMALSVPK
jgi:hypothetical protein